MAKAKGEAPTNNKKKVPAKAEDETWTKVKEEEARAKAEQEARVKAEAKRARVKAEQLGLGSRLSKRLEPRPRKGSGQG